MFSMDDGIGGSMGGMILATVVISLLFAGFLIAASHQRGDRGRSYGQSDCVVIDNEVYCQR